MFETEKINSNICNFRIVKIARYLKGNICNKGGTAGSKVTSGGFGINAKYRLCYFIL